MMGLWACLFLVSNFFGSPNDNSLNASNNNSVYKLSAASVYRNEYNFVNLMGETNEGALLFKKMNGVTYDGNNFFRNYGYSKAPKVNIDVAMEITGMVNRVNVTQTFTNTTDNWQEGIYIFPLPEDAAVDHMRLKIGERVIEGQIKEKKEAKKIYKRAKQTGKKAALTEQERPNIFTTSVANIAPHETVKVEIEFQQITHYDNGAFSIRFPMTVGPRYIPGENLSRNYAGFSSGTGWAYDTDEVIDASRVTPHILHPDRKRKNIVTVKIDLNAGLELERIHSPYHEIEIDKQNNQYYINLRQDSTLANRDFELIWQPNSSDVPKAALFTEEINGYDYGMIMMLPPDVEKAEILNREIIYVIDTSGSMDGESILQAKTALRLSLTRLKPDDYFNIIQFNSLTSSLFHQSQPANQASLLRALNYVNSLRADGGTEMEPALYAALENQERNVGLRQVIFITDGSIGNEQALFETIQQRLGRSRLFTIGIGSAPNSHFMSRAANFGRGTHTYIGKLSEVTTRMQSFFEKIESPVLRDIHTNIGQLSGFKFMNSMEIWPQKINDLYSGEPLLIAVRAKNLPLDEIRISGQVAKSRWSSSLMLAGGQNRTGIAKFWARKKIAALMEQKQDDEFESVKKIITNTALEHHLVSKFTSLIAVDLSPVRPSNEKLNSHPVPGHLPLNWQYDKVFGRKFSVFGHKFPDTATDARLDFIMGILLMLFASFFYLIHRNDSHI
jgi:Ca-activated chloride channel family protein